MRNLLLTCSHDDFRPPITYDNYQESQQRFPPRAPGETKRRHKIGHLTFRTRWVKCGEERPTCLRCAKSKRLCTGYQDTHRALGLCRWAMAMVFRWPPTISFFPEVKISRPATQIILFLCTIGPIQVLIDSSFVLLEFMLILTQQRCSVVVNRQTYIIDATSFGLSFESCLREQA